jgi:RNA polymerase primary sigma factor
MRQELGREPTRDEVATRLELGPEHRRQIRRALRIAQTSTQSMSLDESDDLADTLADPAAREPDELLTESLELDHLRCLLKQVEERPAKILRLRYGLDGQPPLTLREIGAQMGITRERVRQLQNEALEGLYVALVGGRGAKE